MGNIYGYIRVSTREQNEYRQLIILQEIGIPEENIFLDKQSGKDFYRPQYINIIIIILLSEMKSIILVWLIWVLLLEGTTPMYLHMVLAHSVTEQPLL